MYVAARSTTSCCTPRGSGPSTPPDSIAGATRTSTSAPTCLATSTLESCPKTSSMGTSREVSSLVLHHWPDSVGKRISEQSRQIAILKQLDKEQAENNLVLHAARNGWPVEDLSQVLQMLGLKSWALEKMEDL